MLTSVSNEDLVRLLSLVRVFAQEDNKRLIAYIRNLIKDNHPSARLLRNFLNNYDKRCVNKLVKNLVVQGFLLNEKLRDKEIAKGNASLNVLLISPTMRCNLDCVGCYANKYDKKDDLDLKVVDRLIKEGKKMGVALYTILGGEPFIKPELFEIFRRHNDVYFQLYTNGTLINEDICKKLLSVGNVFPQISIEGFEKETDASRGKGTYQ
jgi:uncharacterized Fe-S cluster-containing radical SAM superfamily protein